MVGCDGLSESEFLERTYLEFGVVCDDCWVTLTLPDTRLVQISVRKDLVRSVRRLTEGVYTSANRPLGVPDLHE
jgi:hypothetical protein